VRIDTIAMMADFEKKLEDIYAFIDSRAARADCGIILGSGLGGFADSIDGKQDTPFSLIPHLPVSTVRGHGNMVTTGTIGKTAIACSVGRFHYYEGFSSLTTALPVFILHRLGVRCLIVTNAAGGVNPSYRTGDLVVIKDHINCMGTNPLRELGDTTDRRFVDMSCPYDRELRAIAASIGADTLQEGVLMAVPGPSYETRAEVAAARKLGADLVGMSTVPEVIIARYLDIKVLGISFVSNVHHLDKAVSVNHGEVLEKTGTQRNTFIAFLTNLVGELEKKNVFV
jgi:purine-nucleoside phosphorylase